MAAFVQDLKEIRRARHVDTYRKSISGNGNKYHTKAPRKRGGGHFQGMSRRAVFLESCAAGEIRGGLIIVCFLSGYCRNFGFFSKLDSS